MILWKDPCLLRGRGSRNKLEIDDEGKYSDPLIEFRENLFNLIMDRIGGHLKHKQLYKDVSCLNPETVNIIAEKSLEHEALEGYFDYGSLGLKYFDTEDAIISITFNTSYFNGMRNRCLLLTRNAVIGNISSALTCYAAYVR